MPKEMRWLRVRAVPESKLPNTSGTGRSFATPRAPSLLADLDPFSLIDGPALPKLAANWLDLLCVHSINTVQENGSDGARWSHQLGVTCSQGETQHVKKCGE